MDTSIVVDKSRGQALTVWLNVTFLVSRVTVRLFKTSNTCQSNTLSTVLSLDVMDVTGKSNAMSPPNSESSP